MSQLATYDLAGSVATITMDDGKANVMSPAMLRALHEAFDRAEADRVVTVLAGRPNGPFSAGFDLTVFKGGDMEEIRGMLRLGAELALRILSFPTPVISVCAGHAYPMGAFLMLASDYRIGAEGAFRIGFNEAAIGLTLPQFAIEIARQRLTPAYFSRCLVTGQMLNPAQALEAGFFDAVVPPEELAGHASAAAEALVAINHPAHSGTMMMARKAASAAARAAIDDELG
jgi:enoyl-CoA hydratase